MSLVHEQRPIALGDLIHQQVRAAVEQAVHEELASVLGVGLYERSEGRRGHRNGYKSRTLTGQTGPLELTLPRAALFTPNGPREWASKLVPRYQRRSAEVNEAVASAYLASANTLRIQGALKQLLKAALLRAQAAQPGAQGAGARARGDHRRLPPHRLRGQRGRGARGVRRLHPQVEVALPWRRAQPRGSGRRAADDVPLPQAAVEDDPHHQRHRAAQRRIPPAGEDSGLAAE